MSVTHALNFNFTSISQDTVFVLDSNVLYFVHSGYYLPNDPKSIAYSNIVQQIFSNGYAIIVSALTVQEMLFGIENNEYREYCRQNRIDKCNYSKKDFRCDSSLRSGVKVKINRVLTELSCYKIDEGVMRKSDIIDFANSFEGHHMDPIDYVLVRNYDSSKTIFVTDDRDFASVPSLQILTA